MDFDTFKNYLFNGSGVVFILMTLIQISPIKINPWSFLASKIGRAFNRELLDKVDEINDEVIKMKNKSDERSANNCRSQILRFGDEVLHGVPHSKEHYDDILMVVHRYQIYCRNHPEYMNNVAVNTIKHIEYMYQKHLENDSFL